MKDWTRIRERYMRDSLPVRLGGLAANLGRIRSFAPQETNRELVASLIEESKFFIEWTAPEAEIDTAAELAELQIRLARWQARWLEVSGDPIHRDRMAGESQHWSERVLALSGLLRD